MDLDRWLENALRIQAIPAPTFHESARAAYLEQQLKIVGVTEIDVDPDYNVFARIPGGSESPLILSAHLDSVFPLDTDLTSVSTDRIVKGPGIGDNAIAVAALIELAADLLQDEHPGDIWLVGNIAEEGLGNLAGMQAVVQRFQSNPRAYIVLEGMSLGFVYHRGLPIRRYHLEIQTQGGHSWIHTGRPSATHLLLQLGQRVTQLSQPETPRTSLNIGRVEGGTSINTIAAHAGMDIELRSEDEAVVQAFEKHLQAIIREFRSKDLKIDLATIGTRPGGGISPDHPLVAAAVESLEAVGEELITLEIGSTDASWPLSRGLPAVCVGLTRGGEAHSLEEHIEIEPLSRGYQALRYLVNAVFTFNQSDSEG